VAASDLTRRLPIAILGGAAVIGLTLLGGWPFLLLVAALVARGQWELQRLFEPGTGHTAARLVAAASGVALVADAFWWGGAHWVYLLLVATALLLVVLVFAPAVRPSVGIVGGAALGWLYVAVPLSHLLWLRGVPGPLSSIPVGAMAVIALWAVVWVFDTAAYLVGSAWGRHRLMPSVSPAKSWEGTVAALAAGAGTGALLASVVPDLGWDAASGALLGLLLGLGALVGDLMESRLKRGAGVKDAGSLLLGHGGVLDRFDSTLVCAPLLYYLLNYLPGL
jgi:phosphatidate cytidylyltransferase